MLRKQLTEFEGPFAQAWPLIRRNVGLAGRQLWLTLFPAFIGSLPVLFVLVWASTAFDTHWPAPGDQIQVAVSAHDGRELPPLRWEGSVEIAPSGNGAWNIVWPEDDLSLRLLDADGTVLLTLPTPEPVSVVHQRRWWNVLIGNPAGYLPSPGDVDAVDLALPHPEYLPFGPDWLRGGIAFFFGVVLIGTLLLKLLWRLQ
jgi:hypothetical protein